MIQEMSISETSNIRLFLNKGSFVMLPSFNTALKFPVLEATFLGYLEDLTSALAAASGVGFVGALADDFIVAKIIQNMITVHSQLKLSSLLIEYLQVVSVNPGLLNSLEHQVIYDALKKAVQSRPNDILTQLINFNFSLITNLYFKPQ